MGEIGHREHFGQTSPALSDQHSNEIMLFTINNIFYTFQNIKSPSIPTQRIKIRKKNEKTKHFISASSLAVNR